jgi:hypothetical protein
VELSALVRAAQEELHQMDEDDTCCCTSGDVCVNDSSVNVNSTGSDLCVCKARSNKRVKTNDLSYKNIGVAPTHSFDPEVKTRVCSGLETELV